MIYDVLIAVISGKKDLQPRRVTYIAVINLCEF